MTDQHSEQQMADAAVAFARGEVAYGETAQVELPPVPESEPMVPLGIRVSPVLAQRVRDAAVQEGVPYSQLVRQWIEVARTERMAGDQVVPLSVLRQAIAHAAQSGQPPEGRPLYDGVRKSVISPARTAGCSITIAGEASSSEM